MNSPAQARERFPPWLKKRVPAQEHSEEVRRLLRDLRLATVCQSARCPNQCECFAGGTATFMILGTACTRNCGFCAVNHGPGEPVDPGEPERVAEGTARLGLRYVVVTSVTRDDLPDGGADQFRRTVAAVRRRMDCRVEILTPDFRGDARAIDLAASARPDVYNHNLETVPRLYRVVRPQADYERSLALLRRVKMSFPSVVTKSGIMVGLGEEREETLAVLRDLRAAGCDMVTIGQYLRPTEAHLPVARFVRPGEFEAYERDARDMGFKAAACGPFVRSSYHAGAMFSESHGA